MAVASLVLGIVSAILALIPFCGMIAIVPAIIGFILGIVDLVKKSKEEDSKKGMSIAGIVLSAIAIIFIIYYVFVIGAATAEVLNGVDLNNVNVNDLANDLANDINSLY